MPPKEGRAKLYIYRNLHRDCWGIQYKQRTIAYCQAVEGKDAEFVIRKGGQRRARQERRKNVHAFIAIHPDNLLDIYGLEYAQDKLGNREAFARAMKYEPTDSVIEPYVHSCTYNPYTMNTFMNGPVPVLKANVVLLNTNMKVSYV